MLHFSLVSAPSAPPNSNMPPNTCICPSAKIPATSHWGSCRAGPGWGSILWKEIRVSVRGGWGKVGPLLTHILESPWAADLRSPQPPVSVSALSPKLLSPGEGVLSGVCFGGSWGWGVKEVLLPLWKQLILRRALEPPAGAVGACLGRWYASDSPRHDCIPPNMPAGVRRAEGLAGGWAGCGWRGCGFGGCLGDVRQLRAPIYKYPRQSQVDPWKCPSEPQCFRSQDPPSSPLPVSASPPKSPGPAHKGAWASLFHCRETPGARRKKAFLSCSRGVAPPSLGPD